MGHIVGEDAAEIAPAAKLCTANCTAQNQVQGKAVVVGFPFPVADAVRLKPRVFNGFKQP
jgi:monoamine oxidase